MMWLRNRTQLNRLDSVIKVMETDAPPLSLAPQTRHSRGVRSRLAQFSKQLQTARASLHLARKSALFVLGFLGTLPAKTKDEAFLD
jgi:hypothetical protein